MGVGIYPSHVNTFNLNLRTFGSSYFAAKKSHWEKGPLFVADVFLPPLDLGCDGFWMDSVGKGFGDKFRKVFFEWICMGSVRCFWVCIVWGCVLFVGSRLPRLFHGYVLEPDFHFQLKTIQRKKSKQHHLEKERFFQLPKKVVLSLFFPSSYQQNINIKGLPFHRGWKHWDPSIQLTVDVNSPNSKNSLKNGIHWSDPHWEWCF